jgi:hypothetical protein
MRALHVFLGALAPLVMLSACGGTKAETPGPQGDQDGSDIVSLQVRTPQEQLRQINTGPDIDAVFTSRAVLDSILIPYYERKGDTATAKELRDAGDSVETGAVYVRHKRHSRSVVQSTR